MLPVSDQMRAWSAALSDEFRDWPGVTQKSFFGFTALYRGNTMFGLLPRSRSLFKGNAVVIRFDRLTRSVRSRMEKDPRVAAFDKDKTRWFAFELSCDDHLHDVIEYLARAYAAARTPMKRK